jgi:hypothetical protein
MGDADYTAFDRFHEIRDTIHKARRVVMGCPPDAWRLLEVDALTQLVAEATGKGHRAGRLEGIREAIAALPLEVKHPVDNWNSGWNGAISASRAALTAKMEEPHA